jgi:hypothetical protein
MSATSRQDCKVCGKVHEFYLAEGNTPSKDKRYLFRCPASSKPEVFEANGERWQVVMVRPDNSILVYT